MVNRQQPVNIGGGVQSFFKYWGFILGICFLSGFHIHTLYTVYNQSSPTRCTDLANPQGGDAQILPIFGSGCCSDFADLFFFKSLHPLVTVHTMGVYVLVPCRQPLSADLFDHASSSI